MSLHSDMGEYVFKYLLKNETTNRPWFTDLDLCLGLSGALNGGSRRFLS
jgi:hypothetical protein